MGARHRSGEGLQALSHTVQLGTSQQSLYTGRSLPLTPGGELVLRTRYAVLLGLLGPQQSPISCAPFNLQGDFQKKRGISL